MIGTMISVVIVLLATVFFFTSGLGLMEAPEERPDGKGETLIGRSMYAAKDTNCRTQLQQLRMSVSVNTDHVTDQLPARIEDLRVEETYYTCPVGDERYDYDPVTGVVSCPHEGHEDY